MLFTPFHAESGRSDAENTIHDFVFTPNSTSAFENFTIVDDDVLEFDEIFIAEFSFGPEIANNWNARKGVPITAFILIKDDDCELCNGTSNQKFDDPQENTLLLFIGNCNGMHKQLALLFHLVVDLCLYYVCSSTRINPRTYVLSLMPVYILIRLQ